MAGVQQRLTSPSSLGWPVVPSSTRRSRHTSLLHWHQTQPQALPQSQAVPPLLTPPGIPQCPRARRRFTEDRHHFSTHLGPTRHSTTQLLSMGIAAVAHGASEGEGKGAEGTQAH